MEEEHQGTVLRSSGTLWGEGSETFAAACSRRGEKGTNQDTSIVWEVSLPLLCFFPACSLLHANDFLRWLSQHITGGV